MKKSLLLALILTGFTGIITQAIFVRELLVTFYGNELSIGIVLANWLILVAVGSFFLSRTLVKKVDNVVGYVALQLALAVLLPLTIYGARLAKTMLGISVGEMIGLFPMFYSSLILLAPAGLVGGAQFTVGSKIFSDLTEKKVTSIAHVYICEATGAVIGGLIFTFLVIPHLPSIKAAFIVSGLNLISATLLTTFSLRLSCKNLRRKNLKSIFLRKAVYFLLADIILLASTGYLIFSPLAEKINDFSAQEQWQGYNLKYYQNSNYGNIAVTERGGEFTFYSDGIPIATAPNPDEAFVEELANLPMLFHTSPQKVLILGGGVGGVLNELLKYPVEKVDYVEPDPIIIKAFRAFPTTLTEAELNNPKVAIYNIDGRLFITRSHEHYDVIIVNLPSPQTLQLNRFYTKEFFQLVGTRLNNGGILSITCPGSLSYLSQELANLNACIYFSMQEVFPYVRVVPGEPNLFLASASEEITVLDPTMLIQRLKDRDIETKQLSDFDIRYKLDKTKTDWLLNSLRQAPNISVNRDLYPSGLFYSISLWNTLASERLESLFQFLDKINLQILLILVGIVAVLSLMLKKRISKSRKASVMVAIITSGFAGMAFSMVLILAFQSLYGYVYQIIALLTGAFMAGIVIGSTVMMHLMNRSIENKGLLIKIESLLLVYAALVPVVLIFLNSRLDEPFFYSVVQVVILILCLIGGVLVGSEFPLANRVYLGGNKYVAETAGTLYACDLIGAWVGSLFVSIWLIPVLGIVSTCILIISLKVVSIILVATSRL